MSGFDFSPAVFQCADIFSPLGADCRPLTDATARCTGKQNGHVMAQLSGYLQVLSTDIVSQRMAAPLWTRKQQSSCFFQGYLKTT